MPYKDVEKIAKCLDYKHLGKQRVEAMQILNALRLDFNSSWKSHPIVKMWKGSENALKYYCNVMINEWVSRGYSSHKATLLFKYFEYYSKLGWNEKPKLDYVWVY